MGEQELYVRGFEEALKNKHATAQQQTPASTSATSSNTPAQILAIEKATLPPMSSIPLPIQQQTLPSTIATSVPTLAISSAASTVLSSLVQIPGHLAVRVARMTIQPRTTCPPPL